MLGRNGDFFKAGLVPAPVGGDNERRRMGEEAEEDRKPAEEFQNSRHAEQGKELGVAAEFWRDTTEPVTDLHAAELEEKQAGDDA